MFERKILDLDPWFRHNSRNKPIPSDAVFLCGYEVLAVGFANWDESVYFRRCAETDELWTSYSIGLPYPARACGRVLLTEQDSEPSTASIKLLRVYFNARATRKSVTAFKEIVHHLHVGVSEIKN